MRESSDRIQHSEHGFTLIELLVVILVIGVLAAIAIPSFLNQREKGHDACAKSAARNLQTAIESYHVEHNSYTADIAALAAIDPALAEPTPCGDSGGLGGGGGGGGMIATIVPLLAQISVQELPPEEANVTVGADGDCFSGTGGSDNYCVVVGASTGHIFGIMRAASGETIRGCAPVDVGGCPASGRW